MRLEKATKEPSPVLFQASLLLWRRAMHTPLDAPKIISIEFFRVEDHLLNTASRPFICFEWHGEQHWLIGEVRGGSSIYAGRVYLRRPKGRRTYVSKLMVNTTKPSFSVLKPSTRQSFWNITTVFIGFAPQHQVDIDFVREESRRIKSLPPSDRQTRIRKPRKGIVV